MDNKQRGMFELDKADEFPQILWNMYQVLNVI